MKAPSTDTIVGNLRFLPDRVTGTYALRLRNISDLASDKAVGELYRWSSAITALARELAPEGRCFQFDTVDREVPLTAVINRMDDALPRGGEDRPRFPNWTLHIANTAQVLANATIPPGEKVLFLTVDFVRPRGRSLAESVHELRRFLTRGPQQPVEHQVIAELVAQRDAMTSLLIDNYGDDVGEVSEGLIRWLDAYAGSFGGKEPPYTHAAFSTSRVGPVRLKPFMGLSFNDEDPRPTDHVVIRSPILHDLYVEVPEGAPTEQTVYQTVLVLQDHPSTWTFPYDSLAAKLGEHLDGAVNMTMIVKPTTNSQAVATVQRKFRSINETLSESAGDVAPHVDIVEAGRVLGQEQVDLIHTKAPSLDVTFLVKVAGPTLDEMEASVKRLTSLLDPARQLFDRPKGVQTDLWLAARPSGYRTPFLGTYARTLSPISFAGMGFWTGEELGDPNGALWAFTRADGSRRRPRLVFRNPTYGLSEDENNMGSSCADAGMPGTGKTYNGKLLCLIVTALGGNVIGIDRTEDHELARAALAYNTPHQILDPTDGKFSWDPLRVHTAHVPANPRLLEDARGRASVHTARYLSLELRLGDDDDPRTDVLRNGIQRLLNGDPHFLPSTPNLLKLTRIRAGMDPSPDPANPYEVYTGTMRSAAEVLAEKLANLRDDPVKGRILFSDAPPINLAFRGVTIFSVPGLKVKTASDRATVYLLSQFTTTAMAATRNFTLAHLPEIASLLRDTWGEEMWDDLLRVARRVNAGVLADSQKTDDFKDDELIAEKTVGRAADPAAAATYLTWLGMDPTPAACSRLTRAPFGYKAYRDRFGRTGWVHVLPALTPEAGGLFRTDKDRPRDDRIDELEVDEAAGVAA